MNGGQGSNCAAVPREGVIHTKIAAIEENQGEIQSRVENLFERLNNHVLMPDHPQPENAKCDSIATAMPPMAERLDRLARQQARTIGFLSDILQRMEV